MSDRENEKALSSEEMIERARSRMRDHDRDEPANAPSSGDAPEGSGSVAAGAETIDEYTEFLHERHLEDVDGSTVGTSIPDVPAEADVPTDAAEADSADSTVLDADELEAAWSPTRPGDQTDRAWDPEWTPDPADDGFGGDRPVGGPDPSVLPPPPPTRRSASQRRTAGRAVGLLVVGGFVVFNLIGLGIFQSGVAVDRLRPGQCFTDPGSGEIARVDTVDCAEPHDFEVYDEVNLAGGSAYPGEQEVLIQAFEQCLGGFAAYVGIQYETSIYDIDVLYPVESGWREGDRTAVCMVYEPTASGFDAVTRTGSLRGARR